MRHNSNSHGGLNDVTCHVMVQYISNGCNVAGSTSLITKLFFVQLRNEQVLVETCATSGLQKFQCVQSQL